MSGILQLTHHKAMWCIGHKFCIKKLDDKKNTNECGINAVFQVTNVSSRSYRHLTIPENIYYGYLDDIIECDFKSFKLIFLEVKWYRLQMNEHDQDINIIKHSNGITMINTRTFELGIKTYVLPRQCEKVFYSEVPGKVGWSYVVRYDPRVSPIKYNVQ
jgi:hypothetical protein